MIFWKLIFKNMITLTELGLIDLFSGDTKNSIWNVQISPRPVKELSDGIMP